MGLLFPLGDEVHELGYTPMFADMFRALEEDRSPTETFLDDYIIDAVMDAGYRSARTKRGEKVELKGWPERKRRARPAAALRVPRER